jgi:hypothetical protein
MKDIDDIDLISIIKGDPEKDDCYYAVKFAFWCVVGFILIGLAASVAIFVRSL